MVAPATKKPKTNDQALQPIRDRDHLVEDDSSDDSILAQPQATGLDDDSSSSDEDKGPATPSDSGVEIVTQGQLGSPVIGKRKRGKKSKQSKAIVDDEDEDSAGQLEIGYMHSQ